MFSLIGFIVRTLAIFVWAVLNWPYSAMLKRLSDGSLSNQERFNEFYNVIEGYFRRGDNKTLKQHDRRFKQQVRYDKFVTEKVLPFLNKSLSTTLLRGTEDGIELIKLMEAGVEEIFAFEGIDAQRYRTIRFVKNPNTGTYIAITPGYKDIDPLDPKTWESGVDTPLAVERVRELYNQTEYVGHRKVWNFATIVRNAMFSDPGEPY